MKRTFALAAVSLVLVAGVLPACRRPVLSGPPELKLGKVECTGCGMLISEDRCSSALLVERNGEREHLCFDDIGCMIEYEKEHADLSIIESYVHDYQSRRWITAGAGTFLAGDRFALRTPMSSGIVAFETRAGAEEQRARTGGTLKSYAELLGSAERR